MRAMRWVAWSALLVVLMTTTGACDLLGTTKATVKIASGAADEAARSLNGQSRTIELSGDDVSSLARRASVSEEAIRGIAVNLDSQGLWQRSVAKTRAISAKYGPEVAEVSVGVACDALSGEIRSAQEAAASLAGSIQGLRQDQLISLTEDTIELWQTMYDAWNTGTDEDKAAVALACYTIENVR